jgi:serine/threonine protein kinase
MKGVETVAVKVCGMQLNEDDKACSLICTLRISVRAISEEDQYGRLKCMDVPCDSTHSGTATHTCGAVVMRTQEAFQREVAILKACRNRNIVSFLGEYVDTERTWLIMEYMEVRL